MGQNQMHNAKNFVTARHEQTQGLCQRPFTEREEALARFLLVSYLETLIYRKERKMFKVAFYTNGENRI